MNRWEIALREGALAGSLASLLSTAVLATAGLRQAGSPVAPTNAVACLIDYQLVPKRLTPGYEHRISKGAMIATYGALAAGFALGALLLGQQREARPRMQRWSGH